MSRIIFGALPGSSVCGVLTNVDVYVGDDSGGPVGLVVVSTEGADPKELYMLVPLEHPVFGSLPRDQIGTLVEIRQDGPRQVRISLVPPLAA